MGDEGFKYDAPWLGKYDSAQGGTDSSGQAFGVGTGAATIATGIMTGGTGFLVAGLVQMAGGILSGLTKKDPPMSAEERYFRNVTSYYAKLGRKHKAAKAAYSAMTGKAAPKSLDFNFNKAWDKTGMNIDGTVETPEAKSTYEGD